MGQRVCGGDVVWSCGRCGVVCWFVGSGTRSVLSVHCGWGGAGVYTACGEDECVRATVGQGSRLWGVTRGVV